LLHHFTVEFFLRFPHCGVNTLVLHWYWFAALQNQNENKVKAIRFCFRVWTTYQRDVVYIYSYNLFILMDEQYNDWDHSKVVQHDNYEKSWHEVCYFGVSFGNVAVSLLLASDDRMQDDLIWSDRSKRTQCWWASLGMCILLFLLTCLLLKEWLVGHKFLDIFIIFNFLN
jgi:hypothetical protein